MLRYEVLFITIPEITTDESHELEKKLSKIVNAVKGVVISFDRWGKYKLAYAIRKHEYGVYYLMRFEADNTRKDELLKEIKNFFDIAMSNLIMRNIIVRLHPEGSLEYKRPESLEEAPSKDIDVILKESKSILSAGQEDDTSQERVSESDAL